MQRRDVAASSLFRPIPMPGAFKPASTLSQTATGPAARPHPADPADPADPTDRGKNRPGTPVVPYFSMSRRWISSARTEIWISRNETPSEAISNSSAMPKIQTESVNSPT